jgi:hypothetical protein
MSTGKREFKQGMSDEMIAAYLARKEAMWARLQARMTEDEFIDFVTGMVKCLDPVHADDE